MGKCPCHGCECREVGCHAKCNGYKKWRSEMDEENQAIAAARKVEQDLQRVKLSSLRRELRSSGRR